MSTRIVTSLPSRNRCSTSQRASGRDCEPFVVVVEVVDRSNSSNSRNGMGMVLVLVLVFVLLVSRNSTSTGTSTSASTTCTFSTSTSNTNSSASAMEGCVALYRFNPSISRLGMARVSPSIYLTFYLSISYVYNNTCAAFRLCECEPDLDARIWNMV